MRVAGAFGMLSVDERGEIAAHARVRHLMRGATLIRQGTRADSIYFVASGRFEVQFEDRPGASVEIGVGQPIGEIAFFTGELRTATVIALRDSVVLELDRAAFGRLVRAMPSIYERLLAALARRLAETSARLSANNSLAAIRTVAVLPAGQGGSLRPAFLDRLRAVFERRGRVLFLTRETLQARLPGRSLDAPEVVEWLNGAEGEFDLLVYVADDALTDWTRKAIRQADHVLLVADRGAEPDLNEGERQAFELHPPNRRRLVCVHERRVPFVLGTERWLTHRDAFMHHHVALEDARDFASLYRFLSGRAVGFVAGGGGGYGPAHVGIFKAFEERGITFDILGGTSVGAAMLAGFAILGTPEELDAGTRDMFVTSRAFKRRTIPRYALLDHTALDAALQRHYRGARVEDAWRPFFAVAAETDRAGSGPYLCRRGPLWKAVRASSAIPAVLPPMFTEDGRMLVDGGVVDNVPLAPMKGLKLGPNVVVHFARPHGRTYDFAYESIPGRSELIRQLMSPLGRRKLPPAPGPVTVLRGCIGVHQNPALLPAGRRDLILSPPPFPGSSFLDFDRHSEVSEAAYRWCLQTIDALGECNNFALSEMVAACREPA